MIHYYCNDTFRTTHSQRKSPHSYTPQPSFPCFTHFLFHNDHQTFKQPFLVDEIVQILHIEPIQPFKPIRPFESIGRSAAMASKGMSDLMKYYMGAGKPGKVDTEKRDDKGPIQGVTLPDSFNATAVTKSAPKFITAFTVVLTALHRNPIPSSPIIIRIKECQRHTGRRSPMVPHTRNASSSRKFTALS